jgi:hypothetical protein
MSRKMIAPVLAAALVAAVSAQTTTQTGRQGGAAQPAAKPAAPAFPPEKIDTAMNARIRKEGMENSQIMRTMHYLTDVYGPRLTGSPNHVNAAKWAVSQMEAWGFTNGKLEPFDFGRPGWLNEKATGNILSPVRDNLVFEVLAWTPSTNGTVIGHAVHIVPPQSPTEAEMKQYLMDLTQKVRGAIVFVGPHSRVPFREVEPAKRRADEVAKAQYDPDPNAPPPAGGGGRGNRAQGPGTPPAPGRGGGRGAGEAAAAVAPEGPPRLTGGQVTTMVNEFLLASGAVIRVNDAGRAHGQIRAFAGIGNDPARNLPTVVMRNEDYGRITRIVADGTPVVLEFNIQNRTYPEGSTSYNAIAEIPGSDKADEVIMLGGHLDSWHSATGATDNAIGCAVMMEAARIVKVLGVKPRRTIRVALWGGEEQGLIGSRAYVAQHFGNYENQKPEFSKLVGYFNVDGGTGRIRGASVFGPPEAGWILRQYFKEFADLGIYGATSNLPAERGTAGGTDSASFSNAGLPGISLGQDTIEYDSHTWHTNLDTLERIVEEDVKKSAVAVASAIYHLAMREQMLPRPAPEQMPKPAAGRGRGGQQ